MRFEKLVPSGNIVLRIGFLSIGKWDLCQYIDIVRMISIIGASIMYLCTRRPGAAAVVTMGRDVKRKTIFKTHDVFRHCTYDECDTRSQ